MFINYNKNGYGINKLGFSSFILNYTADLKEIASRPYVTCK